MTFPLIVCLIALGLDRLAGEPEHWHPLVGLGWCADSVEQWLNPAGRGGVAIGALAVAMITTPLLALAIIASFLTLIPWLVISVVVLWLAIGLRSLAEHGMAVYRPLAAREWERARECAGMMVSRDTRALDENGVATAATESLLENGADSVFASLFWFLVGGLPGLVLHRAVNTLDAMWGYRCERFRRFGWAAARLDDVLNWIPARLTAIAYALAGDTRTAWRCWLKQGVHWDSPNAGPVMAAGAGALGVRLGGDAPYHEGWRSRPELGAGAEAGPGAIPAALALIHRALVLWFFAAAVIVGLFWLLDSGVL